MIYGARRVGIFCYVLFVYIKQHNAYFYIYIYTTKYVLVHWYRKGFVIYIFVLRFCFHKLLSFPCSCSSSYLKLTGFALRTHSSIHNFSSTDEINSRSVLFTSGPGNSPSTLPEEEKALLWFGFGRKVRLHWNWTPQFPLHSASLHALV